MHIIPPTSQSFKIKYIKEVSILYFYVVLPMYDL